MAVELHDRSTINVNNLVLEEKPFRFKTAGLIDTEDVENIREHLQRNAYHLETAICLAGLKIIGEELKDEEYLNFLRKRLHAKKREIGTPWSGRDFSRIGYAEYTEVAALFKYLYPEEFKKINIRQGLVGTDENNYSRKMAANFLLPDDKKFALDAQDASWLRQKSQEYYGYKEPYYRAIYMVSYLAYARLLDPQGHVPMSQEKWLHCWDELLRVKEMKHWRAFFELVTPMTILAAEDVYYQDGEFSLKMPDHKEEELVMPHERSF